MDDEEDDEEEQWEEGAEDILEKGEELGLFTDTAETHTATNPAKLLLFRWIFPVKSCFD